jgi:PadR family transcriptional regulator PadR
MSDKSVGLIKEEIKCSCKGDNLDKFVQPMILMLLSTKPLHGYLLIQELEKRKLYPGDKLDSTGIYRTLRTFEKRGKVSSEWDVQSGGAAKKIYSITEEGRECLVNWIKTLESYQKAITMILKEAK